LDFIPNLLRIFGGEQEPLFSGELAGKNFKIGFAKAEGVGEKFYQLLIGFSLPGRGIDADF